MLFKKGNDFVEITQRISHDIVCSTWFIDTNLDFESLKLIKKDLKNLKRLYKNGLIEKNSSLYRNK